MKYQNEKSERQRTLAKFLVSGVGCDDRLFRLVPHLSDIGEIEQFAVLPLFRRYLSKNGHNYHIRTGLSWTRSSSIQ